MQQRLFAKFLCGAVFAFCLATSASAWEEVSTAGLNASQKTIIARGMKRCEEKFASEMDEIKRGRLNEMNAVAKEYEAIREKAGAEMIKKIEEAKAISDGAEKEERLKQISRDWFSEVDRINLGRRTREEQIDADYEADGILTATAIDHSCVKQIRDLADKLRENAKKFSKPASTDESLPAAPVEITKPVKTEKPAVKTAKPAKTEKPVKTAKPAKTEKPVKAAKKPARSTREAESAVRHSPNASALVGIGIGIGIGQLGRIGRGGGGGRAVSGGGSNCHHRPGTSQQYCGGG